METVTVEARDLAPLAEALDEAIEPALRSARPLLAARLLGAALGARRPPAPEPAPAPAVVGQGRDRIAAAARRRLVHRRLGEPRRRAQPRAARPEPTPRPCSPPAASTIPPCDRRRWPGPGAPRLPWCSPSTPAAFRPRLPARRRSAVVDALLRQAARRPARGRRAPGARGRRPGPGDEPLAARRGPARLRRRARLLLAERPAERRAARRRRHPARPGRAGRCGPTCGAARRRSSATCAAGWSTPSTRAARARACCG